MFALERAHSPVPLFKQRLWRRHPIKLSIESQTNRRRIYFSLSKPLRCGMWLKCIHLLCLCTRLCYLNVNWMYDVCKVVSFFFSQSPSQPKSHCDICKCNKSGNGPTRPPIWLSRVPFNEIHRSRAFESSLSWALGAKSGFLFLLSWMQKRNVAQTRVLCLYVVVLLVFLRWMLCVLWNTQTPLVQNELWGAVAVMLPHPLYTRRGLSATVRNGPTLCVRDPIRYDTRPKSCKCLNSSSSPSRRQTTREEPTSVEPRCSAEQMGEHTKESAFTGKVYDLRPCCRDRASSSRVIWQARFSVCIVSCRASACGARCMRAQRPVDNMYSIEHTML